MKHRNLIPLLLTGFAFLLAVFISGGCAHILPPSGGPRDSLPPVLLRATPADSTLRFSGNQIRFLFNEFVEVDDYNKHLIISPLPENMPTVTRKLETITVRLRDELEENTTYVFNFGRSIKDLNEGNVFRDFTYVISTGNYFDSLEYSGSVVMAHNSEVDTTLFVMLHRNPNDSALTTEKPRYVTRVDTSGNFKFRYLAPGTYYLYALKDESGAYRYFNPESQIFAFADSAVQIGADSTPPARLLAYQVPVTQQASPASSSTATGRRGAKEEKRLKFTLNLKGSQQDLLTPFIMTFEKPLREFDSTKVQFLSDTTYTPIETGYNWTSDSTQTSWTLNYPWKENTLYHLILDKEFATDTLGQQLLKSDTVSFFSKKISDYGKIHLRFRNLDLDNNPVLQFVVNKEVVYSAPLTEAQFIRPLFLPGEYKLRILRDRNGNGVWDPGIGKKTALRMVLHLLKQDVNDVQHFAEVIARMRVEIRFCKRCFNVSDREVCDICANNMRKQDIICVVETIRDVIAIESTQQFNGTYHVLGGVISPLDGIGPDQLTVEALIDRIHKEKTTEVIFALNPTIQGDTTIYYIQKKLADTPVNITTIARGIAFGGELEYADEMTLGRSLQNRMPVGSYR